MHEKIINLSRPSVIGPVFVPVFVTVFLVVLISGIAVTFLLPESYASTARILIPPAMSPGTSEPLTYDSYALQSSVALMVSDTVLDPVIDQLKLNDAWGKKFNNNSPFRTAETCEILKSRLEIRTIPNTMILEVKVYDDDSHEAAILANAIAKSYQEYHATTLAPAMGPRAQILDQAQPMPFPVRPNKPLNIVFSAVLGIIIGFVVATVGAMIVAGLGKGRKPVPGT